MAYIQTGIVSIYSSIGSSVIVNSNSIWYIGISERLSYVIRVTDRIDGESGFLSLLLFNRIVCPRLFRVYGRRRNVHDENRSDTMMLRFVVGILLYVIQTI